MLGNMVSMLRERTHMLGMWLGEKVCSHFP